MQLVQNRLEKVDVYETINTKGTYVGSETTPMLLGFVYADIRPVTKELDKGHGGRAVRRSVKLIMRPDAGVSCGSLLKLKGNGLFWEVTEIKYYSDHISAVAVIR
ncbi:MAG: hypothetical protein IJ416_09505 [Ruminiclostridium sp.]|nr:hypothetical protein [Ruminiclostridium sp.]